MLAMSKVLNLKIHQLDVDSAFPYADLDEKVYMAPPPWHESPGGLLFETRQKSVWT